MKLNRLKKVTFTALTIFFVCYDIYKLKFSNCI